ncbi:MAG: hypothetical protein U9O94_01730, partial [Nanoarchaeota archaeon]|nr:hypothetical protein [Nanoarchaeota archaeon]
NITYILSKFYKLNNNNDIILDIQKKGTDLLKYMLEANSSKVINEGKYAYLSEIFSKIESRDLIRIINQKGKLDDKVKFVPSRYFNNLEGYSQQDSRVAEALLEHLIRLGDSKLIRLKGIKLLSSKEEHYEGSKKNPFRIEAEVSLKLTGDECRYITSKFKHNGMRMSIKEGTYRFKLNTVLDDLPEDSVAMLYNEFLRWGSIKRNENYFVQMQRTHFKEEISKTTESERAVVYYVIGGSVFVLGLAVRIVGVPAIGEIAMAGGAGITGATYKRRYQGPKIEKPNFSLTLSLE